MRIVYDDDNTVSEFKTYEYLGTIFDYAIQKNGEGEIIFARAGISSLVSQYRVVLCFKPNNGASSCKYNTY